VQDWKGELIRVNGPDCVVIDPPREALMYPDSATVPLAMAVVNGLAADAVARFSRAFGSRARFIAELRRQNVYPKGPRLQALRSAIEAAASQRNQPLRIGRGLAQHLQPVTAPLGLLLPRLGLLISRIER
jgi:hypothetical protein